MSKSTLQTIVVFSICGLWILAALLTAFDDGKQLMRVTSGPFGLMIGWLFATRLANGKNGNSSS